MVPPSNLFPGYCEVGGACGLAVLAGWRWLRVGGGEEQFNMQAATFT